MKNLLRFETRKLLRKKSFYICTAVMVVLILLSIMTLASIADIDDTFSMMVELPGFDAVLQAVSNSSFTTIAGIFVALFICEDYEQKTIKLIRSRGNSRTAIQLSKLMIVGIAVTAMYVVVLLVAFLLGTAYFGTGEIENGKFFSVLGVQYLACMGELAMVFFISNILRKNGLSITAVIVLPILISILLSLGEIVWYEQDLRLNDFWISNLSVNLTETTVRNKRLTECLITALVYLGVFSAAGVFIGQKRDL